jgi:flagellar protein FlaF
VGDVGFSVSGSAVIIFVGVMVAAGIAVPSLVGSMGALADSQGEQVDRGIDALNTEFEITSATYDQSAEELTLELKNTGSTTLTLEGTSVLVDGDLKAGVTGTGLWLPGDTATVTVTGETTKPARVKVVTENGIAETISDGIGVV